MKELNKNWITEGLMDLEYKKYILLAYLQTVKESFEEKRLYPYLSDLLFHYRNLLCIKENKQLLHESFPKQISKADFENLKLIYNELVHDDRIMNELEEILSFSIPRFKEYLVEGKYIYEEIEHNLSISPVGITSIYPDEGYLLFYKDENRETRVYEYQVTIFESAEEKFRGVHTSFLETITKGIGVTFESIKVDLAKRYKKLSNPATFLVNSKISVPFDESLLPVAKRMLVRQLYSIENS